MNVRVLQKVAYENSWESLTIKYDKKGEVLLKRCQQLIKIQMMKLMLQVFVTLKKQNFLTLK